VHKLKILHRDLKSENLLISNDGILKIADFGLARGYGLPMSNFRSDVVSLWYRAPDILLGNEKYTTSVDMWSVGCIFAGINIFNMILEMVNGGIFFQAYSEKDQIKKIFRMLGTPVKEECPSICALDGWKAEEWEVYPKGNFSELVPKLNTAGIDLLAVRYI
jgi:cyclin-dependent kinase